MTSRSTARCRARVRTFVLATDAERPVVAARVSGLDDVDVINAEDVPETSDGGRAGGGRRRTAGTTIGDAGRAVGDGGHLPATGSRLSECTCYGERCGPMHGVRGPRLPISPEGQVPQRIPRRSCGSAPTRVTRRGWRPTTGEQSLLDTLRADPEGQLGAAVRGRFGDALPFLVKVLAADEPLSLQAHPSAEQAVEGFAREEQLGIPVSSPTRNYRDRSHKPELLVALGQFEALAGFRPAASSVELMRALAVSDLDPFVNLLSGQPDADGLRALFTTWITAPQPDLDVLVPAVIDGAIHYVRSGKKKFAAEAKTVLELGERYPGDAGVLASLLLNRISLQARRGHLPARGQPAHVSARRRRRGDGQLRQRAARRPDPQTRRRAGIAAGARLHARRPTMSSIPEVTRDGIELVYDTPAPEFAVSVLCIDGEHLGHEIDAPPRHDGPQILLCTEGSAVVHAKSSAVTLERGAAAWVAADDGPIRLVAQHSDQAVPRHRGDLGMYRACRPRAAQGRSWRRCSPTRASPSRSSSAS